MDHDEQEWRARIMEAACEAAEEDVDGKRDGFRTDLIGGTVGAVLTTSGFFLASLDMAALLSNMFIPLGGLLTGWTLNSIGKFIGQRQMVRLWRESLNRAAAAEGGQRLPGSRLTNHGTIIVVIIGLVGFVLAITVAESGPVAIALAAVGDIALMAGLTLFARWRGQREILTRWERALERSMPTDRRTDDHQ